MLNLWNEVNEEVVVNNEVELVAIRTKEDLDFLGCSLICANILASTSMSSSTIEISECIRQSPFIMNGHNESEKFNLSSGNYVLYVLANGSIGFGIIGKIHCINALVVDGDELYLSRMSISGTVMNRTKSIEALKDDVEHMNTEITSDGLKVEKIIYFAE